MHKTTSADGTTIAYERLGDGPPLVLVSAAMHDRAAMTSLAGALAEWFTVYNYDRRGRGDSGDAPHYEVAREVEDLVAVIVAAGGSADLYGVSSGAALAFEGAAAGIGVTRLAMFEPPYVGSDPEMVERYAALVDAGEHWAALEMFHRSIGVPEPILAEMAESRTRPVMEALAPTMLYDFAITGRDDGRIPVERMAAVTTPTLLLDSSNSMPELRAAAEATAAALPAGEHRSLPGGWHSLPDDLVVEALREFLGRDAG